MRTRKNYKREVRSQKGTMYLFDGGESFQIKRNNDTKGDKKKLN